MGQKFAVAANNTTLQLFLVVVYSTHHGPPTTPSSGHRVSILTDPQISTKEKMLSNLIKKLNHVKAMKSSLSSIEGRRVAAGRTKWRV